jgi:aminoglycoside 6-adenylyltransferase
MRSAQTIFELILDTARHDDRIRAAILNGSRANPNAPADIFQDFDILYLVSEVDSFTADHSWIDRFGERTMLQMPETMQDPPPIDDGSFAYLKQLSDGNRNDLN